MLKKLKSGHKEDWTTGKKQKEMGDTEDKAVKDKTGLWEYMSRGEKLAETSCFCILNLPTVI